ncbi:ELL complex EAP30 subunit [Pelomyxa schiedti]|nr:ELL complex EAP30 subunit [Pelomyxa schiedti]
MKLMNEQLVVFKQNLEEFAQKYKKKIRKSPEFRQQFNEMCTKVGVDPLASNKGFWAELLGVGDFYYELAVQIVEVCMCTRATNGGIIELGELRGHLLRKRGPKAQAINNDDIDRSIRKLHILGSGFSLIVAGSTKLVKSVPCELSVDHEAVFRIAMEKGFVSQDLLFTQLAWDKERTDSVMNLLLQEGIAWLDTQHESGQPAYWFPSIIHGGFGDEIGE